jgi:hypothetical protein
MAEDPTAADRKADPYDVDFRALARAIPVKRILIGAALALAALYIGDCAFIHFSRDQFDTVTVFRFYAVPLKGNKLDFQPAGSSAVRCANSLFPHFGASPCWYLRKHQEARIDM